MTGATNVTDPRRILTCKLPHAAVALLALLGPPLTAQDKQLVEIYARYDKDGDKLVVRAEFPGSDDQFVAMDADKNGKVTFDEFARSPVALRIVRARERNAGEPRPRVSDEALAPRRLESLARFDKNGDGKVGKTEWTGTERAFATLDLDKNGVLDQRDQKLAERDLEGDTAEGAFQSYKSELPEPKSLLQKIDADGDGRLSRREVGDHKLAALFVHGDRDADGFLELEELTALLYRVQQVVAERNRGYEKPRAPDIPFNAWDKNADGRVDQNEWLEYKQLFPRIDRNRDAAVTREELERFRRAVEGDDFVQRFDLNGDGRVTFDEFDGPPDAFRRADRNGDGAVSAADR